MSAIIAFQPSSISPFQFQATLDGIIYNIIVTWNIFGQQYYVNVYDQNGTLVVARPMVGSPPGWNNNILSGYFASTLVYRTLNNQFEVDVPFVIAAGNNSQIGTNLDVNFYLDISSLA